MTDVKPEKLSPDEQSNLDNRLFNAAIAGDKEEMRALLVAGADVHAQDDQALRGAAENGHTQMVQTLLAAGAKVHAKDDYALRCAALNGHMEAVKALLAAGASVHARGDWPLCMSALNGHTEVVKSLLAAGADVHAKDDFGLWWAVEQGHIETLQVLAKHIFAPDVWRGKSVAAIEAEARALYTKIEINNPQPERLHKAATILADSAIDCWHQVRPAPPKLQISSLPAQPRPV